MLAAVTTFTVDGVTPRRVTVETDVRTGLPAFTVVGLGDRAVRESRERVRGAIQNGGWPFPQQRVTVNLAPADLRKEGPGFDLAIACGLLAAAGEVPAAALERNAVFGELALGGGLRSCRGTLAVAEGARECGLDGIILPAASAHEAALVPGLAVHGAQTLVEVVAILRGESAGTTVSAAPRARPAPQPDFREIRGHAGPVRALVIAAAGGHHVLMSGPPGTGKTMLARRLPSILPPLSPEELIEVMRIRSVAGLGAVSNTERPFRAPHHSISAPGLIGGGSLPAPGEVTLAHRGVLFLDELPEFNRMALEALRQPLEDGIVTVARGQRTSIFPSAVQMVAACNPCPCGYAGSHRCRCGELEIERYQRRLSGPLLDRIDIRVEVTRPSATELESAPVAASDALREQVAQARGRAASRAPGIENARLGPAEIGRLEVSSGAEALLRRAYRGGLLSPRGRDRTLRVARTVADLDGAARIEETHLLETLALRGLTAGGDAEVA